MKVFLGFIIIILFPFQLLADEIPPNSKPNPYGKGWTCNSGYKQSGGKCIAVEMPENAKLDYTGHGWTCNSGYKQSGGKCIAVEMPENAKLDYTGHGWTCVDGFKKSINSCIPMTDEEIQIQKAHEAKIIQEIQRRKLKGVSGDDCENEYKTNAEVCVTITGGDLDCNKSFDGEYYRDCDVTISYEIETDYEGGSYIEAEVECNVEIEYKRRDYYSTRSDSDYDDETYDLYAHDSESDTMDFNFSFSSYMEVYKVEISSTDCEIENVELL